MIIDPPSEKLTVQLDLAQFYHVMLSSAEQGHKMAKKGATVKQMRRIIADAIAATLG